MLFLLLFPDIIFPVPILDYPGQVYLEDIEPHPLQLAYEPYLVIEENDLVHSRHSLPSRSTGHSDIMQLTDDRLVRLLACRNTVGDSSSLGPSRDGQL